MDCKVELCSRLVGKHGALGMCPLHYKRQKRGYPLDIAVKSSEKHSMSNTDEYKIWQSMKNRCNNQNASFYSIYGGRGVRVYPAWQDSFVEFIEYIGTRPSPKHSIDRIDVNGNYEPGNVRWATMVQQARNMRIRNKLGLPGVIVDRNRYKVEITLNYKNMYVGRYKTLEEALSARLFAECYYWD